MVIHCTGLLTDKQLGPGGKNQRHGIRK